MRNYEKPVAEIVDFSIIDQIMDDENDVIPDLSGGVEDW